MNQHTPDEALPVLSAESITRIENAVFTEIAEARPPRTARASRARRRRWLTGLGVAAAFAAGILVAPPILGIVGTGASMGGSASDSAAIEETGVAEVVPSTIDPSSIALDGAASTPREIIQTAQATVQVADIRDAADEITALAASHGGYVESTEISTMPVEDHTSAEAPPDSGHGWISIRVPAADLSVVMQVLDDYGTVLDSSVAKEDVTAAAIDLRARVDATRASVDRLTDLMANTATVSELLEAEVALSERQAQLESYEQQLAALDDQVEMSSLRVALTRTSTPTTADPAGFGDGLLAGWNGLIVSLNALVIAFGFLLPWLGVAAVIALIVWLILRWRHRIRDAQNP
ncbi:DUF4349 domain-containing protein [Microbacterium sp.]|uniref:DUF4349 domain-containing protein n=1 Tax=Microbacterium sp. TaxID=51671 RepID=UPI002628EFAF|nr:DUF4349 domain-containing protein [Microbacterium sp.]